MCDRPLTDGVNTWACSRCDKCITTRKNDWLYRCFAESAVRPNCLLIGLTYRNKEDGTPPPAATSFQYRDIQLLLKRIRNDAAKQGRKIDLGYLVAGERGTRKDRVHWHTAMWSEFPLTQIGTFTPDRSDGRPIKGDIPMETRLRWSEWPHGHVYLEEPNEASFAYLMKYILKDQFRASNSKGTKRHDKSESNGSGYFRMSKEPPIGLRFIYEKLAEWEREERLPVSLDLKVPGKKGYWYPKGKMREILTQGLHEIAEDFKSRHGRYPAQRAALLASLSQPLDETEPTNEVKFKDYERIRYGQETQEQRIERSCRENSRFQSEIEAASASRAKYQRGAEIKATCGGLEPCAKCRNGLGPEQEQDCKDWLAHFERRAASAGKTVKEYYKRNVRSRVNPFCQRKWEKDRLNVFPASRPTVKRFVKDAQ